MTGKSRASRTAHIGGAACKIAITARTASIAPVLDQKRLADHADTVGAVGYI